ncbi:MAG: formylglycine-generating enzyme family protein, partial [Oscillospiraceae bacterium]|nr:formylglycine-generating enzyme family protein [Oscillospiraceae bacterium]
MQNINDYQRDYPVTLTIPAKEYTVEKTGQIDEFGFPVLVKKPVPLDESKVKVSEPSPVVSGDSPFDAAKFALEAATGGKNTLIYDDLGAPSVMVRIPAFKWSDVIDGAPDELCSAFIAGGKKLPYVYVSKFLNVVENGRAYSLPNREPEHTISIDDARAACARKGKGWHLFTNAEWAAIAFWSRKNGTIPHGNTRYGNDTYASHESAVGIEGWLMERDLVDVPRPDAPERTLSGSGPASWSHDGTDSGIFDLTGNVWDWVSGVRIVDGEIQIIPNNDSALNADESSESSAWRAISVTGELV